MWLGANDIEVEKHYEWIQGGKMETPKWAPRQPQNVNEDCMAVRSNGFHDYPCRQALNFVCESN